MCCGYGTIAILLSKYISAEYFLSDINSTAVELAKNYSDDDVCKMINAVLDKVYHAKVDNEW